MIIAPQILAYNSQPKALQSMLDYDYFVRKKTPSIVGIIQPTSRVNFEKYFFGEKEVVIPVYQDTKQAVTTHTSAIMAVNFASSRSVFASTKELLESGQFETVSVLAEGVPENSARELAQLAKKQGVTLIGPASLGMIVPGIFKTGSIGGTIENIIESGLDLPGKAGLITRSGGLFNELAYLIGKIGGGVAEGISIGGDRFPATDFLDHALRLEANPRVEYIVMLGEVGGVDEYAVIEAVQNGRLTKPIIAYCIGTSAEYQASSVQFGHAGASANTLAETASSKNVAMRQAGIFVPENFEGITELLTNLSGKTNSREKSEQQQLIAQFRQVVSNRRTTHFTTTISDDRGEEASYAGILIGNLALPDSGYSLIDVLTLLWFKRRYPAWATNFLETILKTVADHGPSVSGAIVSKITARAGKDAVSSLIAGLSTIGLRFGGAIDGSARQFKAGFEAGLGPTEFVEIYKKKNELLLGIGHKVKSIYNPDKRVAGLHKLIQNTFPSYEHTNFAFQVEKITTSKKSTLILNVDGIIANGLLDMWENLGYTSSEIDQFIEIGVLNGFFIVARSIGLLGHIFDEKRLGSGLYRHPSEDILFVPPEFTEQ